MADTTSGHVYANTSGGMRTEAPLHLEAVCLPYTSAPHPDYTAPTQTLVARVRTVLESLELHVLTVTTRGAAPIPTPSRNGSHDATPW